MCYHIIVFVLIDNNNNASKTGQHAAAHGRAFLAQTGVICDSPDWAYLARKRLLAAHSRLSPQQPSWAAAFFSFSSFSSSFSSSSPPSLLFLSLSSLSLLSSIFSLFIYLLIYLLYFSHSYLFFFSLLACHFYQRRLNSEAITHICL